MWKWIVGSIVGIVLLLVGGGVFVATSPAFKSWIKTLQPADPVTKVQIEKAQTGDLVRTVSAPGAIQPEKKVEISAQVSARILQMPFHEGDMVHEGDVIVRLDDRDLQASLESAKANLRSQQAQLEGAQAGLALADADFKRVKQLHASGDRSDADLEAARAEYLRAQSQLRVAEHAIEIAQANISRAERDLDNTVIRSPIDGTVIKQYVETGELVLGTFNNKGTPIMLIGDLTRMVLHAQVDETNIAAIEPGQHARVYLIAYPDEEFSGVVERVGLERQTTSDGTGVFETEIALDKSDELRPAAGMTANTDIEVKTYKGVVLVPSQAVLDRRVEELPDKVKSSPQVDRQKTFARVVYRVVDGKTAATPVEVGPSDLTHTAVLAGLDPGAEVVTGPFKILTGLKDDQKVELEAETGEPAQAVAAAGSDAKPGASGSDAKTDSSAKAGSQKGAGASDQASGG